MGVIGFDVAAGRAVAENALDKTAKHAGGSLNRRRGRGFDSRHVHLQRLLRVTFPPRTTGRAGKRLRGAGFTKGIILPTPAYDKEEIKRMDKILYSPHSALEMLQELKAALRGVTQHVVDAGLFTSNDDPLDVVESLLSSVPEADEACIACKGTGLITVTDIMNYHAHHKCPRCLGLGKEPQFWVVERLVDEEIAIDFFGEHGLSNKTFASIEEAKEAAEQSLEGALGGKVRAVQVPKTGLYAFYFERIYIARTVPRLYS